MHQHVSIAPEVTEKFADVALKTVEAGYLAQWLALRPARAAGSLARFLLDRSWIDCR
jgi:hypothetical protein